jgi:membrane-associated phospholipid phosphatase
MVFIHRKSFLLFILPALAFVLSSGLFLFIMGKESAQLWLHHHCYTTNGEFLMRIITSWGEAYYFLLLIAIGVYQKRWNLVFMFAGAGASTALIVQFLKKIVFTDFPRPMAVLDWSQTLMNENVAIVLQNSFPSGHTTTAFTFFSLVALTANRKSISLVAVIASIFVGISRVYLMVHWVGDVIAGAILGTAIGIVAFELAHFQIKKAANR